MCRSEGSFSKPGLTERGSSNTVRPLASGSYHLGWPVGTLRLLGLDVRVDGVRDRLIDALCHGLADASSQAYRPNRTNRVCLTLMARYRHDVPRTGLQASCCPQGWSRFPAVLGRQ